MKIFYKIIFSFAFFSAIMLSCTPDDQDNGTSGIDTRTNYQGVWTCKELGGQSYTVNISLDQNTEQQIKLFNFHHQGFEEKVNAVVSGMSLTIFLQTMCQGTLKVEGTASMQNNKTIMNFYYTVNNGADLDTIKATYTKQSRSAENITL